MDKVLLVDGDIIVWKLASVHTEKFDFGDGDLIINSDERSFGDSLVYILKEWTKRWKANKVLICLSDADNNWRNGVLPSYKEGRDHTSRPELWYTGRRMLLNSWDTVLWDNMEADDVLGILSTQPSNEKRCIVSEDKDMKTIPGWLWNPAKDSKPRKVTAYDADLFHMEQALMGDPVDGYKGCPGIGPVKAKKILQDAEDVTDMWARVVETYEAKGLTAEDALVQARVARICRYEDFNMKRMEVRLWTPQET